VNRRAKKPVVSCKTCGEASGLDESACAGCGLPLPWQSGWGDFLPGERVTKTNVSVGEVLLEEYPKDHRRSVLRVTAANDQWFSGVFADPRNPDSPAADGPFQVFARDLSDKRLRIFRAEERIDPERL